jgi:hypothetical protein
MSRTQRDPLRDLVVTRKHPRWFVWRDIVTILLAVAVVMLVRQVGRLRDQLDTTSAARTQQIADLTDKIDQLTGRLTTAQQQNAAKDARIRQLTDALLKAKVPVPAATYVLPTLTPSPSSSPSPAPGPTAQPRPTVTVTETRTPTPGPTATPGLLCRTLPALC